MDSKELQHIIKGSISGNAAAQRSLYMEYRTKWYMLCMRYAKNKFEADDMFQEGLIQIYKDLYQFDEKRAGFNTWSSKVLCHAALKFLKKHSWHEQLMNIEDTAEGEDVSETIFEKLAAKELTMIIQSLPLGYRIVFNMYILEGYTHKEIADKLEISIGTSKSQLSKAKRMLREKLEINLMEYTKR